MTHKELFEKLIYDEDVSDNIDVCDSYDHDQHGNSIITMSFEGTEINGKKSANGMLILVFNKKGKLINLEMATKKKGSKDWQVAKSETFLDFKKMHSGSDQ